MRPTRSSAAPLVALVFAACADRSSSRGGDLVAATLPAPSAGGDGETGTSAANATTATALPPARSCTGGPGAGADACATILVPGGSFRQFDDPAYPTTVSAFALDTYEVTAGRFRAWVAATGGDLRGHAPNAGDGAHPKIAGSGWRAEWDELLPSSADAIDRMLGPDECQVGANLDDYGAVTWWTPAIDAKVTAANASRPDVLAANTRDALDAKPLVCVPWHVLFAFCIWDGGRLPTNAEWGFAAAGGDEQREFPWGDLDADDVARIGDHPNLSRAPKLAAGASRVVAALWDDARGPNVFPSGYAFTWGDPVAAPHDNAFHVAPVGSRPDGRGRWGHLDLAGGVYEWMLDEGPIRPGACNDCANVDWPAPDARDPSIPSPFPLPDFEDRWFVGGARAIRGGAWDNALGLSNRQTADEIATYTSYPVRRTYRSVGGRCARDLAASVVAADRRR